jgi:hypothetical protein
VRHNQLRAFPEHAPEAQAVSLPHALARSEPRMASSNQAIRCSSP